MSTTTTNYGFVKPAVNSAVDEDLWGDELNDDLDSLDTIIKAISDVANANTAAIAALGTAAALDVGTADGDVVQVQTGGKLPALDGSDLTGLFDIVASSLTNSGYFTFSNGIIIQWGRYTTPIGGFGSATITFPIAFPTACFVAIPQKLQAAAVNDGLFIKSAPTTTSFEVQTGGSGATETHYIAIGH